MAGQLVDLSEPIDARDLRLKDRDESGGKTVQRAIGRDQGRDLPDPACLCLAQAREQTGVHHRRLANAGSAHGGNQGGAFDRLDQLLGECLSAAEEGGVLLPERAQAAVGADLRSDSGKLLPTGRPRRLPTNGGKKDVQGRLIRHIRRQIDPGVELQEP
jgi:hypothetical protein